MSYLIALMFILWAAALFIDNVDVIRMLLICFSTLYTIVIIIVNGKREDE